jgi:release factor glutamine methyltransferase
MSTVAHWLNADAGDLLDRELLLAHTLECNRAHLRAHPERHLTNDEQQAVSRLAARRARGEPLAYLIGTREFWSLSLRVTPDVLVPRPETELVVELALEKLGNHARVLDLATGSGAIGITLAAENPTARITLADISAHALQVARDNAKRLGVAVDCVLSDWYHALDGAYDIIVCNPPYVRDDDPHLASLSFEPRLALAAGADGLDAIRTVVAGTGHHLVAAGCLIVEHGCEQGSAVRTLFDAAGFRRIETHQDLAGLDRVTLGHAP